MEKKMIKQIWKNFLKQFERSEMILIQETSNFQILARKEIEQDQRLSNYIFENACYPDRTEPWACILPSNQRMYFEFKNKSTQKRIGFSELVSSKGSFLTTATTHLQSMDLTKKKWFKAELKV